MEADFRPVNMRAGDLLEGSSIDRPGFVKKMTGKYIKEFGCLILSIVCGSVWLVSPVFTLPGAKAAEVVDRIVAVVNDEIIALYELNQAVEPYVLRVKSFGYPEEKEQEMILKIKRDLLEQLINKKLTAQEVKRFNISITDEEVDKAVDRIKKMRGYTDDELKDALSRDGIDLEAYRKKVRENLLRTKLITREVKSKVVITNEDISKYYQSHQDLYGGEKKIHLRNIIKRLPASSTEVEKQRIRKKMEEVMNELQNGKPFDEMARKHSESSLAKDGGDLGYFNFEELSPLLQESLNALAIGEYSEILDTEQGYQIFYIEDIQTVAGKTLEEVSAEIQEKLYRDIVDHRFQAWLEGLRNRSHIKIIK